MGIEMNEARCNKCGNKITDCYCKKSIWNFPETKTKRPLIELPE